METGNVRLTASDREAAAILGVSPRTIFTLRKTGQLKAVRILGRVVIPIAELHRFLRDNAVQGEQDG